MWSTPALDPARNRIYIATGDAYSQPAARTTDAIMALAMDTGRIEWVHQTLAGDAWTTACFGADTAGKENCPEKAGPDYDFGSAPALVTLRDGRRLVVAGQKSGMLHAVNADTGAPVWSMRAGEGGILGGIEWGFATDGTTAYVVAVERAREEAGRGGRPAGVNLADGKTRWSAPPSADTCGDARRLQHGPTSGRQRDARRDLLGRPRRAPARLRRGQRQGDLGRRHHARVQDR